MNHAAPIFHLSSAISTGHALYVSSFHSVYPANSTNQCAFLGGSIGRAARRTMDDLREEYNYCLLKIVSDYQRERHPTFAVTYMSAEIPFHEYPVEALSDVDCFHPSLDTHRFIAAGMWHCLVGDKLAREEPFTPWTWDLRRAHAIALQSRPLNSDSVNHTTCSSA